MFEITVAQLSEIVSGRLSLGLMPPLAGEFSPVAKIVTDSREIAEGDVFWALQGAKFDGSQFVQEAFARGASGVIANRAVEPWAGRWAIEVADPQFALWRLATEIRRQFEGLVVAVTGSVGKTTTREMIHAVLSSRMEGTASPRNYNNHVGLPLSMFQWNPLDDYAVVELGASQPGEIGSLAQICRPDVGVITCIGESHLAGFGTLEGVANSKAELLQNLAVDGAAVLCGDDPWLQKVSRLSQAPIVWYGRGGRCDLTATDIRCAEGVLSFYVEGHQLRVPVWGRHCLNAALAAVAVGRIMELSMEDIAMGLENFEPAPGRCQVTEVAGITIIDDTYNASPKASKAALELLRDVDRPGRRVVVCGDMLELGDTSEQFHYELGQQVVTVSGAELLICCGEFSRNVVTGARDSGMPLGKAVACRSTVDAIPVVSREIVPGDVVLVKGSRAMSMEKIIHAIQSRYALLAA